MNKGAEAILRSIVGLEGVEALQKAIFRRQTSTVADPMELYMPLMVVPRAILSWLVQNIKPMKVGDNADLELPGQEGVKFHVVKRASDVYDGEIVQSGRVIHSFEKQSLPSIGGHLMTVFERYDHLGEAEKPVVMDRKEAVKEHEELVEALESPSKRDDKEQLKRQKEELDSYKAGTEDSSSLVRTIMSMNGLSVESSDPGAIAAMMQIASTRSLTESIGKLVDALVHDRRATDMDKREIKADDGQVKETEMPKQKKPKDVIQEGMSLQEVQQHSADMTAEQQKKIQSTDYKPEKVKAGEEAADAEPEKVKKEEIPASKPKRSLRSAYSGRMSGGPQKADLGDHPGSMFGKGAMKPSGAGMDQKPKMPKMPVGPSKNPVAAQKQTQASAMGQQAHPSAGTQNRSIPKNPIQQSMKPKMSMKGEYDTGNPPGKEIPAILDRPASHPGKRSLRSLIRKSEEAHVSESELYRSCEHCGKPEFSRAPDGPRFTPCACFVALTKDEEGRPQHFVALRKSGDGYRLTFDPSADPDSVRAFLLLMKTRLLVKKRFGL